MAPTITEYQDTLLRAKRRYAEAVVINQSGPSPAFPMAHLIETRDRIRLAERTAKGGCFQMAYRMLQAVVP